MAGNEGDKSQTWIKDERNVHLRSEFGANKKSVEDALQDQEKRIMLVSDYKPQVDKVVGSKKDDPSMLKLTEAYGDLTNISQHRLNCLKDASQIANLEDFFNTVSHQFAEVATNLTKQKAEQTPGAGAATASTPAAAQNCILSVRNNWQWISTLVKCTDTHLENSSAYHQFFHDAKEYSLWMPAELDKAAQNLSIETASEKKDPDDGQRILLELKALVSVLLNWRHKIDNLFERGQKIVPVPIRTKPIKYHRPIVSLATYKTNDIDIKESEELVLIDNTNSQSWLVRNLLSDESYVPSVICLIPGPDADAIELAMQLRLQLLGTWTVNIKMIGKTLIYWLLLWLKDSYTNEEKDALRGMADKTKKDILRSLALVEEVLDPYWSNIRGYQVLKGRIENFRKILGEKGDAENRDKDGEKALEQRAKTAKECMEMFQVLWSNWVAYKILVESAYHGEQILISEKWEELKFADLEEMRKLWGLKVFSQEDMDRLNAALDELIMAQEAETVESREQARRRSSVLERERRSAQTESIEHSEQEEKRTFTITGVFDHRQKEEVSMQEAVKRGIINNEKGNYVNNVTGEEWPIPVAMNAEFIKVQFTTASKTEERKRDVGVITITTTKDTTMFDSEAEQTATEVVTQSYAVYSVVDQKTKEKVSFGKAVSMKLIDQVTGNYFDNKNQEHVDVVEAIKRGFIKATIVADPSSLNIEPENQIVAQKLDHLRKKLVSPMKAMAALKKAAQDGK